MRVQTTGGDIPVPVMHTNGALNAIRFPTHNPILELFNTVHNNGLRIPNSDAANLETAIYICDQLAVKFPELTNPDPQISGKCRDEIVVFLEWVNGKDL